MKYVIYHEKGKQYYAYNKDNHWTIDLKKAATFGDQEKAKAYAKDAIVGNIKEELTYPPIEEAKDMPPTFESPEEADDIFTNLQNAMEFLSTFNTDINRLVEYNVKLLSDCDLMQEDILHRIELEPVSNIDAVRLTRKLKEIRIKRREAKDRINYLNNIKNNGILKVCGAHTTTLAGLEKRQYTPRILIDIFKAKKEVNE